MGFTNHTLCLLWTIVALGACRHGESSKPDVTNGVLDLRDTAVLMLEGQSPDQIGPALCTASLVAPQVLLTAAHCVIDAATGAQRQLHVAGLSVAAGEVRVHDKYGKGPRWDVAMIKLSQPITSIAPLKFAPAVPKPGDSVRLVGFGGNRMAAVGEPTGSGVRRTGWTKVSYLDDFFIYTKGLRDERPEGGKQPTGQDVAPGHGDSGGPMLDESGVIVGIAAAINTKAIPAATPLSVVGAYTQVAAVHDFLSRVLVEFEGATP